MFALWGNTLASCCMNPLTAILTLVMCGAKAYFGGWVLSCITYPKVADPAQIEFVSNKATKAPFPRSLGVANAVHNMGLTAKHGISLYPGMGTVDGILGDHVMLAPAYNLTREEIEFVVNRTKDVVFESFEELCDGCRNRTCT